jgi:hypothetical protein
MESDKYRQKAGGRRKKRKGSDSLKIISQIHGGVG